MQRKEKELIAVAASIAAGCEFCTRFHVKAARECGAVDDELQGMVNLALTVRERATTRMASVAWGELGRNFAPPSCENSMPVNRLDALASAAAALAANCGSGVPMFLAAAIKAGATDADTQVALGLARKIKPVAAEKAEEEGKATPENGGSQSCCASATGKTGCCEL